MDAEYESIGDYYRRGPLVSYVEAVREPANTELTLFRARQPAGAYPDPATPDLLLTLQTSGSIDLNFDQGNGRTCAKVHPGMMSLAPAWTDCYYEQSATCELIGVAFPEYAVTKLLEPVGLNAAARLSSLHGRQFRNLLVLQLVKQMWVEAADDSPRGRLFLDGALLALLTNLMASVDGATTARQSTALRRGGLPPRRLRRVEDLAMAHLADDLSLGALAEAAGLSPFHFARAFRAETGTSPHAWLLDRRIARAKELLTGTAMTVDDVAKAVGFAGKQGLIGAFKRAVGTTPQAWRNNRLA